MTDDQSRKLNAAVAGQAVMDDGANAAIWAGKAAVVNKKTELDNSIIKIGEIDDEINDITGHAESKSELKEKAAKTGWLISKPLAAYALDINDDELRAEIDFEWSDLRYGKDATLIDNWQVVHDRAQTHEAALNAGGYGVDMALINQFQSDIDKFKAVRPKPKAARADKKALNESLAKEFRTLDKIMEELKERLVQFAVSHTDFYNAVLDAFEEDESGVRHKALRVVYEDDATGIRLPGVKMTIVEKALEKISSERGVSDVSQQDLPQGNYSVRSQLTNYEEKTEVNVAVERGKMTTLKVKLKKI